MDRALSMALVPALALCALSFPALATEPAAGLEARLRTIGAESGGTLGVKVVHLESGRTAGLEARGRFPMASVYKLPIAVVVLAQVDAGKLKLDQEVEVRPGEVRRTGPRVDPWKPGARVPLAKLVDAMVTESNNTACDVLLRLLGGAPVVDGWLAAHGFSEIDVSWTELEMAAVESGVAPLPRNGECDSACLDALVAKVPKAKREEAERAFERNPGNTTSPEDLARLLADLWQGELLSARSTETLLAMMRRNTTGDRRIRALLPKGTPVWDKTGTSGRCTNDAGLVELPDGKGTLVVVALVKGSSSPSEARERAIARAARAAYDAFGARP
ncbi:MAG: class A beta-lactamase [Holophagales bacterium]|nr:class A beta-lactamase [Holophagales bacterium]